MTTKSNKIETHEEQVIRVLEEMVLQGEVIKQKIDGEYKYSLAKSKAPYKTHSTKAKVNKTKSAAKKKPKVSGRSLAAMKAWQTRRKVYTAEELFEIQSKAAKKAWETMRAY